MKRWPFIILQLLSVAVLLIPGVRCVRSIADQRTVINVGYLTALTGELKDKQGLAISGALTMALEEVSVNYFWFQINTLPLQLFFPNYVRSTMTLVCYPTFIWHCAGMTPKAKQSLPPEL